MYNNIGFAAVAPPIVHGTTMKCVSPALEWIGVVHTARLNTAGLEGIAIEEGNVGSIFNRYAAKHVHDLLLRISSLLHTTFTHQTAINPGQLKHQMIK